ncbi:MAG: SDR family NAD(P)-dependent oxidoreductase [Bdellovibrio sp.]|nr:SDR family NAD(P)-dependent oxidoreductase [Bdellovibrio sp.]
MQTWGIVGLGWLGTELSKQLVKIGDQVWGTHRSDFDFVTDSFPEKFCDVLFLNTPPLFRKISAKDFVDKVAVDSKTKLIFISSTSVYGTNAGVMNEMTIPNPTTESAQWLVEVEERLRSKFKERLTIIRPGGLIGGNRHPIYSLSQKAEVAGGNQKLNLIHRSDLIQIIIAAASDDEIKLVNAVAPFHPRKDAYYTDWAQKLNLPIPQFTDLSTGDREVWSDVVHVLHPNWICSHLDSL